jgi:DMSO/TMAO reductase YedYZ heme-binding membrane subunit
MNGWPIVGWATLVVLAIVGAIVASVGGDETGIRMAIRATARTSVVLFSLAFAASALRRRSPYAATAWLLRNRRQLGVSFATSHFIHLLAIFALAGWTWAGFRANTPTLTLVAGGGAYVFIALMTLTSFDATATLVGPRAWRRLHTIGAYYVWIIFAQNFFVQAFKSAFYWPYAALLAAAMAMRWLPGREAREFTSRVEVQRSPAA